MAFWDAKRGVAVSDSVDGQFVILMTTDGGASWERVPAAALPPALANEGFFAASGTNVTVAAPNHVWIGTGAASEARVLRSSDGGRTWAVAKTPLDAGPSAGIFSIAFSDAQHGIVVGGDYKAETVAGNNAAITTDGGATWTRGEGAVGLSIGGGLCTGQRLDHRGRRPGRHGRLERPRTDLDPDCRTGLSRVQLCAARDGRIWRRGKRHCRDTRHLAVDAIH